VVYFTLQNTADEMVQPVVSFPVLENLSLYYSWQIPPLFAVISAIAIG
jgi:hypothetical protein